jgi:hypothetical protein
MIILFGYGVPRLFAAVCSLAISPQTVARSPMCFAASEVKSVDPADATDAKRSRIKDAILGDRMSGLPWKSATGIPIERFLLFHSIRLALLPICTTFDWTRIGHDSECVRARGSGDDGGLTFPMKASTAQNRRAEGRLKRNRCGCSTFKTNRLSFGAYPYLGASLDLTSFAASWVVLEFFFAKEELLSSRENELGVTVNALQNLVLKFHGLLSTASEISECRVRAIFHIAGLTRLRK